VKFGGAPFRTDCRFVAIDPDRAILDRAVKARGLAFGCVADTYPAAETLLRRGKGVSAGDSGWLAEARSAFDDRPAEWAALRSKTPGKLHPAEVFRALQPHLDANADSVLICDGGEFAQWGQSLLRNDRRMINGVTGSIGSSLPMAAGARVVEQNAPIFAVLGDGTFGFHMSELETAVRLDLPYVAVVGTDARWNAEYNLQVRDYGPNRTYGCELNTTRYDLVATALGGHGELVESAEALPGAIERSLGSGKPAVINVMIESIPSPVVRR
jgi:acetolactate synthase I/II/III large subunit